MKMRSDGADEPSDESERSPAIAPPQEIETTSGEASPPAAPQRWTLRLVLLLLLAGGTTLFLAFDLQQHLNFRILRAHRLELAEWVQQYRLAAPVIFAAVYALAIVFMPPSGTVMTVVAGFLFGAVLGTVVTVVGATVGATLLFLVARFVAGDLLRRHAGLAIRKMEAGFQDNALSYILVLRLVPLFPFWLVNLAPAFLRVPLLTFIVGTFVGIIPGTAVFAVFGAGLGDILDHNEAISLRGVLSPQIVAALCGLAVLSVLPLLYKRRKARAREAGAGKRSDA